MEQPRKPAGSPGATGGQYDYDPKNGTGDLPALSARAKTRAERERRNREERGWIYDPDLLKATTGEHVGEPVCTPGDETNIVERYVGTLAKSVTKYFGPEQAEEVVRTYLDHTLVELRTCVAEDPTRCYSVPLVNKVVSTPIHVGKILAKPPWRLSEHRMRAGLRFKKRYLKWCADHHVDTAPSEIRDRLWDEELDAYVAEKRAKGVKFGRGLNYSDGRSASGSDRITYLDESGDEPRRTFKPINPDGTPRRVFNGRKDFEVMVSRGLDAREHSTDEAERIADTGTVSQGRAEATFKLALSQGLDETQVARALGVSDETADRWRTEWAMQSTPGVGDA